MIESITITHLDNNGVGISNIRIANAFENSNAAYILREFDGLGSVKADISTRKKAALTGVHLNNITKGARTITLAVTAGRGYTDDKTWRRRFYKTLNSGNFVSLSIGKYTSSGGTQIFTINGYVTDVVRPAISDFADIFVTIYCPSLYFSSTPIAPSTMTPSTFSYNTGNPVGDFKMSSGGFVIDLAIPSTALTGGPIIIVSQDSGSFSSVMYFGIRLYRATLPNYIRIDTRRNNRAIYSRMSTSDPWVLDNALLMPGTDLYTTTSLLQSSHSWLTLSEYASRQQTILVVARLRNSITSPLAVFSSVEFHPEYDSIEV